MPALLVDVRGADGPNVESLKGKLVKWFLNNGNLDKSATTVSSSKPRATNGLELFCKDKKESIKAKIAEERTATGKSTRDNLTLHTKVKKDLYDQLSPEERAQYESQADEQNKDRSSTPDPSHIFSNQKDLLEVVSKKLQPLVGHGWGGNGDAVFFVQAAYRNEQHKVKTFSLTLSNQKKTPAFSKVYSHYEDLSKKYRQFAEDLLPIPQFEASVKAEPLPKLSISYNEDGFPLLPSISGDASLVQYQQLLQDYIKAAWKISNSSEVPWEILNQKDRSASGLVQRKELDTFTVLEPRAMSFLEALQLYTQIYEGQGRDDFILRFSSSSKDSDDEIEVIDDPAIPPNHVSSPLAPREATPIDFSPAMIPGQVNPSTTTPSNQGSSSSTPPPPSQVNPPTTTPSNEVSSSSTTLPPHPPTTTLSNPVSLSSTAPPSTSVPQKSTATDFTPALIPGQVKLLTSVNAAANDS
ncbi:hypothetical protein H0H93_007409, partial [Arthromyces matolae]